MALFDPFASLFELSPDRAVRQGVRAFVPPADVVITDDDVTVILDVPGFTADGVSVELVGDVLTVRGERPFPYERSQKGRVWQRLERGFGKFERSLQVPKGLDPDHVTATMADGVLTLRIAKPESRRPRRIEITTMGAGTAAPAAGLDEAIDSTAQETSANGHRELAGATA